MVKLREETEAKQANRETGEGETERGQRKTDKRQAKEARTHTHRDKHTHTYLLARAAFNNHKVDGMVHA